MKILGVDYGKKRAGVAISVPLMNMAINYAVIDADEKLIDKLKEIIIKEQVDKVVLGLPKRMDNTLGESAKAVMEFAETLKQAANIPIVLWDERLTSKQAGVLLRGVTMSHKSKRDQLNITAAQIILQNYLDAQESKNKIEPETEDYDN
jgi:putative holliday junction resolvase